MASGASGYSASNQRLKARRLYPTRGPILKIRTPVLILLVVSLVLALYTGWHLKQALDAGHELRQQMSDLSLATMTDSHASASTVSLGEQSLKAALDTVRATAHHNEAYLAVECLGVLLGIIFLRRQAASL